MANYHREQVTLPSGERVSFLQGYSEADHVVCLDRLSEYSVAESDRDALLTLAGRYKTLALELENMAKSRKS